MAAGVAVQAPSNQRLQLGSAYVSPLSYGSSSSSSNRNTRLPVFHSLKTLGDDPRSASRSSGSNSKKQTLRGSLRNIDSKMGARTTTTTTMTTTTIPATLRSESRRSSLHRRGTSSSSLTSSSAALAAAHAASSSPYATYDEPFPDISPTPSSSTPKIKPYLRKISTGKEDAEQGRLDLSKSVSETGALAGLGIHDFASRSVSDSLQSVGGVGVGRSIAHARNTSAGSQISTSSSTFRPSNHNQPFVHPLRPTPTRPYTPPTDASSLNDEEAHESSDVLADDVDLHALAPRASRSASLSSPPLLPTTTTPTPLSQSHTPADLTTTTTTIPGKLPPQNPSQTNLSLRSTKSSTSKSRIVGGVIGGRSRANTSRSSELVLSPQSQSQSQPQPQPPSPSSRTTSLDRTISFVSRSNTDPADSSAATTTHEERIRAARRKFEAKEADKERKAEDQAFKRRESARAKEARKVERLRRKSSASASAVAAVAATATETAEVVDEKGGKIPKTKIKARRERDGALKARSYAQSRVTALPPTHGSEPGKSEEPLRLDRDADAEGGSRGGWSRFSVWLQTRLLSCGRKRS